MRYAVIIEKSASGYGAYVPDLPGCIAVAESRKEITMLIQEAIRMHIERIRADGEPVPLPSSDVEYIEIAA